MQKLSWHGMGVAGDRGRDWNCHMMKVSTELSAVCHRPVQPCVATSGGSKHPSDPLRHLQTSSIK